MVPLAFDQVICVGSDARTLGDRLAKLDRRIGVSFASDYETAAAMASRAASVGDLIVVNGSEGAEMEHVVRSLVSPDNLKYTVKRD
jgi:UDP-N-acetylmuramyl pentapeptide synthase